MPESNHAQAARQHLVAARAALYQHAAEHNGRVPYGLKRAAEHADDALTELDVATVDVREACPEDFARQ